MTENSVLHIELKGNYYVYNYIQHVRLCLCWFINCYLLFKANLSKSAINKNLSIEWSCHFPPFYQHTCQLMGKQILRTQVTLCFFQRPSQTVFALHCQYFHLLYCGSLLWCNTDCAHKQESKDSQVPTFSAMHLERCPG